MLCGANMSFGVTNLFSRGFSFLCEGTVGWTLLLALTNVVTNLIHYNMGKPGESIDEFFLDKCPIAVWLC